jgi:hypothetical protein
VRGRYDGTYDKSKLPPADLILTTYFRVEGAKIFVVTTGRHSNGSLVRTRGSDRALQRCM